MAVEDFSTTAASNTTLGGIGLAENAMSVNDINDAFRELMAQIATWRDGAIADLGGAGDYQDADATLTALAGLATGADKLPYFTGADTASQTDITAYGRTLLALADAAALRSNIGGVTVTASSIAANGYITFDISGTSFTIQWGTGTASGNGTTTVSYPTAFGSFSRAVISSARTTANAQDNNPGVTSCGLSSFTVYSAVDQSLGFFYIAVGS